MEHSQRAGNLVTGLQERFVAGLEKVASELGNAVSYERSEWLRDEGRHGGGMRYSMGDHAVFDRASVNVSQIHYDDDLAKKLSSATALSTIIHPCHPLAPSVHMHISWTEMKSGQSYWRIMADLNPSNPITEDKESFLKIFKGVAPEVYDEATAQGDRYFYIPALERHRGVAHFYLENYCTGDFDADYALAKSLGEQVIDGYLKILESRSGSPLETSSKDKIEANQLAYHTLYFFQVLTLDRGTTSGLLVHNQNDVGIMGSLPSHVDKNLLASWSGRLPEVQRVLLDGLLSCLADRGSSPVGLNEKKALAGVVRNHYQKNPEALALQASGNVIPPTVENHR